MCTYNATTHNQTIAANIPTIIFWNQEHEEVANEVIPFFDAFKEVNIFHENAYSAAKFLNEIWDSIEEWWYDPIVQNVRDEYCNNYAMSANESIYKIIKTFNKFYKE